MKTDINTIKLLRDKANENIKKYCEATNSSFKEGKKYCIDIADEKTFLQPSIDFYIEYYNESVKLYNEIYKDKKNTINA